MYHVGKVYHLEFSGEKIPFILISILGTGGYGTVWLARNLSPKSSNRDSLHWISVKIITDLDEYRDEIKTVSRVMESFNPYLGTILVEKRGIIFMRLLDINLYEVSKYHRLEDNDINHLGSVLAKQLQTIHRKYKTVFGDFKPENVMLRLRSRRPKVQSVIDRIETDLIQMIHRKADIREYRKYLLNTLDASDYDIEQHVVYNSSRSSSDNSDTDDSEESDNGSVSDEESDNGSVSDEESDNSSVNDEDEDDDSSVVSHDLDIEQIDIKSISDAIIHNQVYIIDYGGCFPMNPKIEGNSPTMYYRHPLIIAGRNALRSTDWWALACTLYEMKAGKILFKPIKLKNSYDTSQLEMIKYFTNKLKGQCIDQHTIRKYYKTLSNEMVSHLNDAVVQVENLNISEYFFKN